MHRTDGKTDAARRTLTLPPRLADELRERGGDGAAPVFTRPGGEVIAPGLASRELRAALNRAGFEWVTSHVFRKTAATMMDERGVPLRVIADHLGHAHPSMTQDRYFGRQQDSSAAAAALDDAWEDD